MNKQVVLYFLISGDVIFTSLLCLSYAFCSLWILPNDKEKKDHSLFPALRGCRSQLWKFSASFELCCSAVWKWSLKAETGWKLKTMHKWVTQGKVYFEVYGSRFGFLVRQLDPLHLLLYIFNIFLTCKFRKRKENLSGGSWSGGRVLFQTGPDLSQKEREYGQ